MKLRLVILFLGAILLAVSTDAQTIPKTALLYKVTGKNLKKPSYLFGTIHIICEKDLAFGEKLGGYIAQTDQMMLEVDLDDPATLKKVAEASTLKDGKTLKDYLTPEEFARLDNLYKSHLGISLEILQNFYPVVASTYLFMSPKIIGCAQPGQFDSGLANVAKERKVEIIALESVEQQIALLMSTPISEQAKALNKLGSEPDKYIRQFQHMYQIYLSQDSDALYEMIVKEMSVEGGSKDALLDRRNQNWIPLIENNITSKPTFIAFGAGHLGGKNGVVALLRAKGYTLTPVRL